VEKACLLFIRVGKIKQRDSLFSLSTVGGVLTAQSIADWKKQKSGTTLSCLPRGHTSPSTAGAVTAGTAPAAFKE